MKTISVTLPNELFKKLETARKKGHYTRSEFIREVVRKEIGVPTVSATPEEIRAIEAGMKEIEHGQYVTLEALDHVR